MSRLELIQDWLEKARLSRYNCNELAKLCAVSPGHLRDYLRQKFGKATQQWLNELRQLRAEELLKAQWLVKEVAVELNYADVAHFCHQFKRRHGMTPMQFAARVQIPPKINEKPIANAQIVVTDNRSERRTTQEP